MRLMITGGRGFVAGHVVRQLQAGRSADWLALPSVVDVLDNRALEAEIRRLAPDAVLHLAAQSNVAASFEDPAATFRVNYHGTEALLNALDACGFDGALLFVGSGDMYGLVDPAAFPITEDTPLHPRNPYAVSKVAAAALCFQRAISSRYRIMMARPFNHVGAGQSTGFALPSFASQLAAIARGELAPVLEVGDIDVTRDFTDVADVAEAYLDLLAHGVRGGIYNICSGREYRVRDLLDRLIAIAGVTVEVRQDPARLRPAEQRRVVASHARLSNATGWQPRTPIEDSLRAIYSSFARFTTDSGGTHSVSR